MNPSKSYAILVEIGMFMKELIYTFMYPSIKLDMDLIKDKR